MIYIINKKNSCHDLNYHCNLHFGYKLFNYMPRIDETNKISVISSRAYSRDIPLHSRALIPSPKSHLTRLHLY